MIDQQYASVDAEMLQCVADGYKLSKQSDITSVAQDWAKCGIHVYIVNKTQAGC